LIIIKIGQSDFLDLYQDWDAIGFDIETCVGVTPAPVNIMSIFTSTVTQKHYLKCVFGGNDD
jgi:hypothetical protein